MKRASEDFDNWLGPLTNKDVTTELKEMIKHNDSISSPESQEEWEFPQEVLDHLSKVTYQYENIFDLDARPQRNQGPTAPTDHTPTADYSNPLSDAT